MRLRHLLVALAACALCAAGARAQGADEFGEAMTLEQTTAWLGRRLARRHDIKSPDGKYAFRQRLTDFKAKGCGLSYSVMFESSSQREVERSDGQLSTLSPVRDSVKHEAWRVDLSALEPNMIKVGGSGLHVIFTASPGSRDAIRRNTFYSGRFSEASQRGWGTLALADEAEAEAVTAALRHAATLCRQRAK